MKLVTLFAVLLAAPTTLSFAQAGPPLGSDFIFFRNGTNTSIPNVAGNLDEDPNAPGEFSIRYDYGDYSYQSFGWDAGVGVDMTGNHTNNDILHLRLRVDPTNANKENTFVMFEDKTNGTPDDLPNRLVWRVPESMKDGNWHTLEIPLPPQQCADLASARGTLGLADNWWYGGSWDNPNQRRVGDYDDLCGNTTNNAMYWKEFEWTNVKSLGAFWDHNSGGGQIWFDDVYVGQAGLDLTVADAPPQAVTGVAFDTLATGNKISWTHDPQSQIGAYKVYGSALTEINDLAITHGFAFLVGQVNASASEFSVTHYVHWPHPGLAALATLGGLEATLPIHYGVTSVSQFGIENTDVSQSSESVANRRLAVGPTISELTDAEAAVLFSDLVSDNASGAGFDDDWLPFYINQNRFKIADAPTPPDDDNDLSGTFYLGFTKDNELYVYAEVLDDEVQLPPSEDPGAAPWEYDVIEMGWANYDVLDPIFGTTHQTMQRGMEADYQFRIGGKGDGSQAFVWVDPGVGGIPAESAATYDVLNDASGNAIGYKILALIPLDGIQNPATGDLVMPAPVDTLNVPRAINIVLNDRDGGVRQSQIQWTLKNNADGQWWNTPAQWEAVGMIGRRSWPIATETEVPTAYTLDQNYPNPFNPQTNISFSIPSAERVTLTVHDLLGRTVATVLSGQTLSSGSHTVQFNAQHLASGIYIYRLQAGTAFTQSKRMTLIK